MMHKNYVIKSFTLGFFAIDMCDLKCSHFLLMYVV